MWVGTAPPCMCNVYHLISLLCLSSQTHPCKTRPIRRRWHDCPSLSSCHHHCGGGDKSSFCTGRSVTHLQSCKYKTTFETKSLHGHGHCSCKLTMCVPAGVSEHWPSPYLATMSVADQRLQLGMFSQLKLSETFCGVWLHITTVKFVFYILKTLHTMHTILQVHVLASGVQTKQWPYLRSSTPSM